MPPVRDYDRPSSTATYTYSQFLTNLNFGSRVSFLLTRCQAADIPARRQKAAPAQLGAALSYPCCDKGDSCLMSTVTNLLYPVNRI